MSFFKGLDWFIIFAIVVLGVLSLTIISSVMPGVFAYQLLFFAISLALTFFFAQLELDIFTPFSWFIYFAVCTGLLLTDVLGFASHGAVRWIDIGGFRLQVSEFGKPLLLLVFSNFLTNHRLDKWQNFVKFFVLFFVPAILILRQPDLGSALVYGLAFIAMCLFAQLPTIYILAINLFGAVLMPVFWYFLHDYQKNRILSFINPALDPLGTSYNAIQATIAAGSGMLWGKGLGHGSQSQLLFLPEKHTDFAFASLVEELGFLAGSVVILCHSIIIWRILRLLNHSEQMEKIYLVGVIAMFFGQVFVNIGMNIGLLPVTGITLPYISYGGSSLLATGIMLGFVQSIAKKARSRYNTGYEIGSY